MLDYSCETMLISMVEVEPGCREVVVDAYTMVVLEGVTVKEVPGEVPVGVPAGVIDVFK